MGKIWPAETPAKNQSTTNISVCNALEESPIKEGLIYVGTNDGLVQVTEDGGENWRKIGSFPGVPIFATVSDICPSHHDVDTVYVSFHNYEAGDFKPYLVKSTDRGKTWTSIAGNLPDPHFVWSIAGGFGQPQLALRGHRIRHFLHRGWRQKLGANERRRAGLLLPRHGHAKA